MTEPRDRARFFVEKQAVALAVADLAVRRDTNEPTIGALNHLSEGVPEPFGKVVAWHVTFHRTRW